MNEIDSSHQLPVKTIHADIDPSYGLGTVSGPLPSRAVAAPEAIDANSVAMGAKQQRETEIAALVKAAADAARQTKIELCDAVMAMQESLRQQPGPNSR